MDRRNHRDMMGRIGMDPLHHTAYAGRALQFAQLFALRVGSPRLYAPDGAPLPIELTVPDGLSTGHGIQNLQHITITHGVRTIVFGSLDQLKDAIEIRSFDYLGTHYEDRWSAPLPFDVGTYNDLFKRLQEFTAGQKLTLTVKDPVAEPRRSKVTTQSPRAPSRTTPPPASAPNAVAPSGVRLATAPNEPMVKPIGWVIAVIFAVLLGAIVYLLVSYLL
jgi:hypothetical protein